LVLHPGNWGGGGEGKKPNPGHPRRWDRAFHQTCGQYLIPGRNPLVGRPSSGSAMFGLDASPCVTYCLRNLSLLLGFLQHD
jgi:hypothetical protein